MSQQPFIITIDGPSGAGKGTVARLIAEKTGLLLLDSGALYRICGLAVHSSGQDIHDAKVVASAARTMQVQFVQRDGAIQVLLNHADVTAAIRSEQAGNHASIVAAFPEVREALLDFQRQYAKLPGLVADGRDMGTVVFPHAHLKFYLTASAEERARRRCEQLRQSGIQSDFGQVLNELSERDHRDANRAVAPLRPADDALIIDSTAMTIHEVLKMMLAEVDQRRNSLGGV